MKILALDTSAVIRFLERGDSLASTFCQYDRLLIPAAVMAEFLAGIKPETKAGKSSNQKFMGMLSDDAVTFAPANDTICQKYAELFRHLKQKGTPIPTNDLWIAATALVHIATLCTADAHFSRIPSLAIERI